jgi:hypothetical protein
MKAPRPDVLTGAARRVARHGLVWLRDPEGRREERAVSSLVMFFVFFPLIVAAFGTGIDVAKNVWIRTSIQNGLDSAAVGGAGTTTTVGGVVTVDKKLAPGEMRKLYAINRAANPGLKCIGSGSFAVGMRSYQRCWTEPYPGIRMTATTTEFNVHEESTNAFLGLLGQPTQTYNLRGKAKVSLSTK